MARSSDRNAYVGTWKKWYNGSFSQDGLTGQETSVPGLSKASGANPAVHWNDYLNKFVMVWHGWDGIIYISFSPDGVQWSDASVFLNEGKQTWYPNMVGYGGSTLGGQVVKLYYGTNWQSNGQRDLVSRTVTFQK
jgi:hypothetical protein